MDVAPPAPVAGAPYPRDDDPELPARVALDRKDPRGAIAVLARLYEDVVYSCCYRMLHDATQAEDLLQQVFLEAHRDIGHFAGRGTLRAWLLGIAHHRCLDAIKSRKRLRSHVEDDEHAVEIAADGSPDLVERVDQGRRVRALEGCLMRLSDEVRMTVLLRFHVGLSYEEIAEALDKRAGTLQQRVARALPQLRECLQRKGISL
jgi:RNA polymerase sigma factor (sigma-70 family)